MNLIKICDTCHTAFTKPYTCSIVNWINNRKYCSSDCYRSAKASEEANEKRRNSMKGQNVGIKSSRWKGDDICIKEKHSRIIQLKGKASNYTCVDCDKQARDWSNVDHLYSLNPDDYLSRCRSCHEKYDFKLQKK